MSGNKLSVLLMFLFFLPSSCSENFQKDSTPPPPSSPPPSSSAKLPVQAKRTSEKKKSKSISLGMVLVPAGEFIMGSNKVPDKPPSQTKGEKPLYLDEHPERSLYLDAYYIDIFETTNAQYQIFNRTYYYRNGRETYPAANVSWFDGNDYCAWLGKRLPTEAEWEKAARGTDGKEFPWGNSFNKNWGNMEMTGIDDAVPVGDFLTDRSSFGVFDLAGNVLEWTADWYDVYPGGDYKSKDFGREYKVIRGNGWTVGGQSASIEYSRSAYRFPSLPYIRYRDIGFRCAGNPKKIINPYEKMSKIAAGSFFMGSNKKETNPDDGKKRGIGTRRPLYADEYPKRELHLDTFYIDTFEVTSLEYQRFNPRYSFERKKKNHPAIGLTWNEARQYCLWRGKRLPTEAEWEKAARGTDGREFPWGETYDEKKTNSTGNGTLPTGSFEEGKSPYGVYDMTGNVWEWVNDWYQAFPGSDFESEDYGEKFKIAKGGGHAGGGHYSLSVFSRSAHRLPLPREFRGGDTGFRCAKD